MTGVVGERRMADIHCAIVVGRLCVMVEGGGGGGGGNSERVQ